MPPRFRICMISCDLVRLKSALSNRGAGAACITLFIGAIALYAVAGRKYRCGFAEEPAALLQAFHRVETGDDAAYNAFGGLLYVQRPRGYTAETLGGRQVFLPELRNLISFGNRVHELLNAVVLAAAFNMSMVRRPSSAYDGGGKLKGVPHFWSQVAYSNEHAAAFPSCDSPFEETVAAKGISSLVPPTDALQIRTVCGTNVRFQAQEMSMLRVLDPTTSVYAQGVHVAYGRLFQTMFSGFDEPTKGAESVIRVGVHLRHRICDMNGTEIIAAVVAAVSSLVGQSPCLLLVASDRRKSFDAIKRATPCATEWTQRDKESSGSTTGLKSEHGQDEDLVVKDLQLLGTAHHLIGAFGSTLTLVAQSLIAASRVDFDPQVIYCVALSQRCLPPLKLVNSSWHFSLQSWPRARIVFSGAPLWPEARMQDSAHASAHASVHASAHASPHANTHADLSTPQPSASISAHASAHASAHSPHPNNHNGHMGSSPHWRYAALSLIGVLLLAKWRHAALQMEDLPSLEDRRQMKGMLRQLGNAILRRRVLATLMMVLMPAAAYCLLHMFINPWNRCMPSFAVVPVYHHATDHEIGGFWTSRATPFARFYRPEGVSYSRTAYVNIRNTRCFNTHLDLARALGFECRTHQCFSYQHPGEWGRISAKLLKQGVDSVQFTRHWEANKLLKVRPTETVLLWLNGTVPCVENTFQTLEGGACKCAEGAYLACA